MVDTQPAFDQLRDIVLSLYDQVDPNNTQYLYIRPRTVLGDGITIAGWAVDEVAGTVILSPVAAASS